MSKTIVIEIIDVAEPQFVKTAKGGYNVVQVAYKEDGKVGGKKLVDFANPDVYNAVLALEPKSTATVVIEKEPGSDGKEYWQWKSVAAGATEQVRTPSAASASPTSTSSKPAGRVTGSNYETAEERAARQLLIVRQSQVTNALKFYEQTEADVTRNDVIELAEFFKEYVFNGIVEAKAPPKKRAAKNPLSDMDDDIPF